MRHQKRIKKLSLKSAPRRALLRNLAASLVLRGKIRTTLAKAKALRPEIERLVTAARKGADLNNRRKLLKFFYSEKAVNKILTEIGPKYQTRPGGYTRIVKLAERKGDNAKMAVIEFI